MIILSSSLWPITVKSEFAFFQMKKCEKHHPYTHTRLFLLCQYSNKHTHEEFRYSVIVWFQLIDSNYLNHQCGTFFIKVATNIWCLQTHAKGHNTD